VAKIRLLVVDDSVTIRAILAEVFARDDMIEVVGEAASAREAMALIPELLPHVVTVDIAMPEVDGMVLLGHIIAKTGANPVMLSAQADKQAEAWNHGAYGFFDKARILQDTDGLRTLIKNAAAGRYEDCDDPECDPEVAAKYRRRSIVANVELRFR
jgi:chemotaxis response regulator CheB